MRFSSFGYGIGREDAIHPKRNNGEQSDGGECATGRGRFPPPFPRLPTFLLVATDGVVVRVFFLLMNTYSLLNKPHACRLVWE